MREGNAWLIGGILAYLVFDVLILWATFRVFGAAPAPAILGMAYLIGEFGGLGHVVIGPASTVPQPQSPRIMTPGRSR